MQVGFGPGGGTDLQARHFAANWSKYMPGNPRFQVTNITLLGDHILMFGSDDPHAESRFPESVDRVLKWQNAVGPEAMKKIMWHNPVSFFGEP